MAFRHASDIMLLGVRFRSRGVCFLSAYDQADWRVLGTSALQAMCFEVSRNAFIRLRDVRFVDVVAGIEMRASQDATALKNPESRCRYVNSIAV